MSQCYHHTNNQLCLADINHTLFTIILGTTKEKIKVSRTTRSNDCKEQPPHPSESPKRTKAASLAVCLVAIGNCCK